MAEANIFSNARIGLAGWGGVRDEKPQELFKIEKAEGGRLYGNYVVAFHDNDTRFNVEIVRFGYLDPDWAGDPNPARRQHFSAEECLAAERLIRSFFCDPGAFDRFVSRKASLRCIDFRPDWIIQTSADPERADWYTRQLRAWRMPDPRAPSAGVSLQWETARRRQNVKRPRARWSGDN